jgi:hypothetical protein
MKHLVRTEPIGLSSVGKTPMQNVTLSLSDAMAICGAQEKIWQTGGFEFSLGSRVCTYGYIDGLETYSVPDEVRADLEALIEATKTFAQKIFAMKLDEREVSIFLSKYFRMNTRTAAERQILRYLEPQWKRDDMVESALFSALLEDEVRRVMSDMVIEVTDEMLQAKLKEMDNQIS